MVLGGGAGAIRLEPFALNSWNGFTLRERCVLNPIGTINFNSCQRFTQKG